jgi:hypothetical protein
MRVRLLRVKYGGGELICFFFSVFRALGILQLGKTYITCDRTDVEEARIQVRSSTIVLARGLV